MNKIKFSNGMSLAEIIIASAFVLLLSVTLVTASLSYLKSADFNLKNTKAIYLIEEGVEAVNFLKNQAWTNLGSTDTDYYLFWNGSTWLATTSRNLIDQTYERKFITESVNRDSNDDIVLGGGTLDENTRRLTVSVVWSDTYGTTTRSISSYLMKSND